MDACAVSATGSGTLFDPSGKVLAKISFNAKLVPPAGAAPNQADKEENADDERPDENSEKQRTAQLRSRPVADSVLSPAM
jgi:hypothetical protein